MGRRGPKPKRKIEIEWSHDFAYAIGLLATDGCLYSDGRHINLTSKDFEQIRNFKKILKLDNKIGKKSRGGESQKKYYQIQFGDVFFFDFLRSIGITSVKSRTIKKVDIPNKFFFDFLRGCFDGDGTSYSYWDRRWRSSFMFYIAFASASREFALWLQDEVKKQLLVDSHITIHKKKKGKNPYYQLKYSKHQAIKIVKKMFYKKGVICLSRKRLKIDKVLAMIDEPQLSK